MLQTLFSTNTHSPFRRYTVTLLPYKKRNTSCLGYTDLHAAIFLITSINSNESSTHIREETTVHVPVAIVLMPHKGSTSECLLHHQLCVIVIYLSTQQLKELHAG